MLWSATKTKDVTVSLEDIADILMLLAFVAVVELVAYDEDVVTKAYDAVAIYDAVSAFNA